MMMDKMWNQRYNTEEYVYGRDPNVFFARSLGPLPPGKILLPGEGEGRNAAYAASLGWEVDAFDQSSAGAEKAERLAREMGVKIKYSVSGLHDFLFEAGIYDAIALIYFHAPAPVRQLLHHRVLEALKPGGMVILEAFHTTQLGRDSGGPQALELLFNKEMLLEDFERLELEMIEETEIDLNEGLFHSGPANVVRFRGIKR